MAQFESVIVVGSSGAGKTTLVNGVRTPEFESQVVVPKRLITRPEREGDDLTENRPVDLSYFMRQLMGEHLWPAWRREFEDDREEYYGFEVSAGDEDKLKVYSANNAFLRDVGNKSVERVLESGLVVAVMSDAELRTDRLAERSPDMNAAERAFRLADSGQDLLDVHGNSRIINTTGKTPEEGQAAFQQVIRDIL